MLNDQMRQPSQAGTPSPSATHKVTAMATVTRATAAVPAADMPEANKGANWTAAKISTTRPMTSLLRVTAGDASAFSEDACDPVGPPIVRSAHQSTNPLQNVLNEQEVEGLKAGGV